MYSSGRHSSRKILTSWSVSREERLECGGVGSRKHFLMVRAVCRWNKLPQRVVESLLLKVFKRRLDEHLSGESDF